MPWKHLGELVPHAPRKVRRRGQLREDDEAAREKLAAKLAI
jgi:hypothetical protein